MTSIGTTPLEDDLRWVSDGADQSTGRLYRKNFRWWSGTASIRRPPVFQTGALPTELPDLARTRTPVGSDSLAGTTGFEPATSGLTGRRELQASPRPQRVAPRKASLRCSFGS